MATVITNVGDGWACQRMAGVLGSDSVNLSANAGSHIGWGTGAGTAAKGDTTLFTESSDPAARVATAVTVTGSTSTAKYQATATLSSTTGQTITNAGLFSASSAGSMMIKGDFTGIPLVSGDSIAFTITVDPS
jgi:hypothetical protein